MCAVNKGSLEVSYGHIGEMQSLLAIWLTDVPRDMLEIFDSVLLQVVKEEFPHYEQVNIIGNVGTVWTMVMLHCAVCGCRLCLKCTCASSTCHWPTGCGTCDKAT